jgi:hypothetical protein
VKNPTGQIVLLKKVFLRKLDFFNFSHSLPGRPSLLSNAVVVRRPLSSFPLVVHRPILRTVVVRRLHPLPLLSSTVAVVVVCRHRCPPPPSSAVAAVIATLCLCLQCLLPPALVLPLCSLRPNLACCCCPPLSLSAFAVVVCHQLLPPPQPSSPLHRSAVSHRLLSSFPIAVRHPIMHVVVVCHRGHPPPLLSTIAVFSLVLPPTRC